MREEYSPYKIVHHLDKIEKLKNNLSCSPLQVQIVPSNVCNQNCSFCAYRMKGYNSNQCFNDKHMIGVDKLFEIIDDCSEMGVKAIQYTGGGEPLVHPQILDVFKYTQEKNIELALVTNGQNLTEEICETLQQSSWVRISLDSSTPSMYKEIRKVHQFFNIIKNIKTLLKYRTNSIIGVGYVVCKENYKGIYEAAKIVKDLGVQNFRISASFTPEGFKYFDGFLEEAKELSLKTMSLSDKDFTVFNLFNDRVIDTFEGTQDYNFCPIKELMTYIGADYNVYSCCTLAYNENGLVGNIKDTSFKQLWESSLKEKQFKNHNPSINCKHPCMYKNKNDFINYCIKQNPNHVNFI